MSFRFRCATCENWHEGLPSFGPDAPDTWHGIDPGERAARGSLGSDDCVIDDSYFFARAVLELPIQGTAEVFTWLVWGSLSRAGYDRFAALFRKRRRSEAGPLFSYLDNELPFYIGSRSLAGALHLRDDFQRPLFRLADSDHPLAVDQRLGITRAEAERMVSGLLHPG